MPRQEATRQLDLKIQHLDPKQLNPSIYNPRKISPRELKKLRKSIREFGFVEPIVIRETDNAIIGGHQRVKAAILEGLSQVPAIPLRISENKAKALNLALNRIHGEWDIPKLSKLLKDLSSTNLDLEITGFDAREIDDLTSDITDTKLDKMDLQAPPGIVWILCGIPIDRFGSVRQHVAALEKASEITVQSNRD